MAKLSTLSDQQVVSHDDWMEARRAFLKKAKEFTRLRDQLNEERRALPWEKVEKKCGAGGIEGRFRRRYGGLDHGEMAEHEAMAPSLTGNS